MDEWEAMEVTNKQEHVLYHAREFVALHEASNKSKNFSFKVDSEIRKGRAPS